MSFIAVLLVIAGICLFAGVILAWAKWRGAEIPVQPPEPGPAPEPAPDFEAQLGPIWRPGKEK